MADFKNIMLEKKDRIAILTLNRPDQLNSINEGILLELSDALDDVAEDEESRVLVLTGAGKAFSAGAQLKGEEVEKALLSQENSATIYQGLRKIQNVTLKLQELETPTIAMVNGPAVGAGFDLALACDMRIGSENVRFSVAFTKVGLVPGSGATWLLPRIVSLAKAAELIFTGNFLDAKEAERIGILNKMVSPDNLEKETMSMAKRIANGPPIAIGLDKMLLYRGLTMDFGPALDMIRACAPIAITSEDKKEGIRSFIEKRAPKFQGK